MRNFDLRIEELRCSNFVIPTLVWNDEKGELGEEAPRAKTDAEEGLNVHKTTAGWC